MAHYDTFEAVVNSKDYHTAIGLGQLLEKLEFEGCSNQGKIKEIRKCYDNLISMHNETPEIDYPRFESIESYFTVFETKLAQAGPLLITLRKNI